MEAAQPNFAMQGLIESVCAAKAGRGRALADTAELDNAERLLAGHVERITHERSLEALDVRALALAVDVSLSLERSPAFTDMRARSRMGSNLLITRPA